MTRPTFAFRRFPPRFTDDEVERAFLADDAESALRRVRAGLVAAAAAWALFAVTAAVGGAAEEQLSSRTVLVSLAISASSLLAAATVHRARMQVPTLAAILTSATGFCILYVGLLLMRHPGLTLASALIAIMFSAAFYRLPTLHTAAATVPFFATLQAALIWPPANLPLGPSDPLIYSVVLWIGEGLAIVAAVVGDLAARVSYERKRVIEAQQEALEEERARSERLLRNVFPAPIAERLLQRQEVIADGFDQVTILFCDLVDFTRLADRTAPAELVQLLNLVFTRFDAIAQRHGLEKIKTIGDAYMAAAGVPVPRPDHAPAAAQMALDMLAAIDALNQELGLSLRVRIGLNSGPVVAGVIGQQRFAYDLWGDAVNTAARMESHGVAGEIQLTGATRDLLQHRYALEERGTIEVKGKGPMRVFVLRRGESKAAATST